MKTQTEKWAKFAKKNIPVPEQPPSNYQMTVRNARIAWLISKAREKKPLNIRELANLAKELFGGGPATMNAYAREANRILKLPYTADFPEV